MVKTDDIEGYESRYWFICEDCGAESRKEGHRFLRLNIHLPQWVCTKCGSIDVDVLKYCYRCEAFHPIEWFCDECEVAKECVPLVERLRHVWTSKVLPVLRTLPNLRKSSPNT